VWQRGQIPPLSLAHPEQAQGHLQSGYCSQHPFGCRLAFHLVLLPFVHPCQFLPTLLQLRPHPHLDQRHPPPAHHQHPRHARHHPSPRARPLQEPRPVPHRFFFGLGDPPLQPPSFPVRQPAPRQRQPLPRRVSGQRTPTHPLLLLLDLQVVSTHRRDPIAGL